MTLTFPSNVSNRYINHLIKIPLLMLSLLLSLHTRAGNVLVIESYHRDYHWVQSHSQGLEDTLSSEHQLTYVEMDAKRLPEHLHQRQADMAWEIYQKTVPDIVVLADDIALKFLGKRFKGLPTPVVYLGINANPRVYGVVGQKNIYGVLERVLIKRSVALLNNILPINKVLVLFDAGATSHAIKEQEFSGQSSQRVGNVQTDIQLASSYRAWQAQVMEAKEQGYSAIIVGLYHSLHDETGQYVEEDEIIHWASLHSPVPLFALWDFSVGKGKAVGGFVISGYQQGSTAGAITAKLLGQRAVYLAPITAEHGDFLFSQSQLERWGLTLPPSLQGSVRVID